MGDQPMIVVFPRGQLSPKDKERLTKAGILAVEADTPKDVVQLRLAAPLISTGITGDAIIVAALNALASAEPMNSGGSITSLGKANYLFVQALARSLEQKS